MCILCLWAYRSILIQHIQMFAHHLMAFSSKMYIHGVFALTLDCTSKERIEWKVRNSSKPCLFSNSEKARRYKNRLGSTPTFFPPSINIPPPLLKQWVSEALLPLPLVDIITYPCPNKVKSPTNSLNLIEDLSFLHIYGLYVCKGHSNLLGVLAFSLIAGFCAAGAVVE